MNISTLTTVPVLLILFNRPNHTRQVLQRLRQVRPESLYVAVDGPRVGHPTDAENVAACKVLVNEIDWPCTVIPLYRQTNLGCKIAVSSAIDWFFQHVEQGIILEDDCLPDETFFDFCRILLKKYADETTVMHIGGTNLYGGLTWGSNSYFFSKVAHVWGWATWRRAWTLYDVAMSDYPAFKDAGGIEQTVTYPPSRSYWRASFDGTYAGGVDTWDYQWVFTIWKHMGLSIIPNQNLITNIGFDEAATHTVGDSEFANLPTNPMDINNLSYPNALALDEEALNYAFERFYQLPSWWRVKLSNLRRRISMYKSQGNLPI